MPDWPATVPFADRPDSYKESGPTANVKRTPMENGPVKTRRRFTAASRMVSGETSLLTDAQIDTFETFYRDEIGDGALPFDAVSPRTGLTHSYRFMETYELIYVHADQSRISMKLERLP